MATPPPDWQTEQHPPWLRGQNLSLTDRTGHHLSRSDITTHPPDWQETTLPGWQNSTPPWLTGCTCLSLTDRSSAIPEGQGSTSSCLTGQHISGTDRTTFIVTAMTPRPNCLDSTSPWLLGYLPSWLSGPHIFLTVSTAPFSWLYGKHALVTVRKARICVCPESTYLCLSGTLVFVPFRKGPSPWLSGSTSPWLLGKQLLLTFYRPPPKRMDRIEGTWRLYGA
jgi:hypothetical protein